MMVSDSDIKVYHHSDGKWIAYDDIEKNMYVLNVSSGVSKKYPPISKAFGIFRGRLTANGWRLYSVLPIGCTKSKCIISMTVLSLT